MPQRGLQILLPQREDLQMLMPRRGLADVDASSEVLDAVRLRVQYLLEGLTQPMPQMRT